MDCRPTSASSAGDHQEPELAATDLGRAPPVTLLELTADQEGQPAQGRGRIVAATSDLDLALTAQIAVAWAGEGGEEPRLSWWQTDLVSEFGGEDLLRRLLPKTYPWAMLQAVREAARRKDEELRAKASDPDQLLTLYRFGFELDEQIEERLQAHKRSGQSPLEALPRLVEVLGPSLHEPWDRVQFEQWVESHGPVQTDAVPTGRLLKGASPAGLDRTVQQLVAGLSPLGDSYPLPHFRVKR
jgi:hypothetical protein